ncbi:hypothetical protein acdb102_31940 [Acidothermaceae bacterium B102]|nr:hypothetical protein acdb102_31940 [Acidothermaceae bacterium B102]
MAPQTVLPGREVGPVGTVRTSGLALILALTGSVALGSQAALADVSTTMTLPAAPAPAALMSQGVGTAAQVVALPVPTDGHDGLIDDGGNLVDTLAVAGVGTYAVDVSGVLTFQPAVGYVGMHSVIYRAIDSYGQTGDGTYTPEVDVPAAPVAATITSTDMGTTVQSASIAVPAQGNAVLLDTAGAATTSTVVPGVGAFRIDPTYGDVGFAPVFGYQGTTTIDYRVTDAYGQSSDGAYTATVVPPHAPVALPATSRAAANVQQVVRLSVPVGTTLALLDPSGTATDHVYVAGQGNYALDPATASITFTPGQGFYGTGSLTYQLTDAYGQVSRNAYTPVVLQVIVRTQQVQHPHVTKHTTSVVPQRQPALTPAVLLPPLVLTQLELPPITTLHVVPAAHAKTATVPAKHRTTQAKPLAATPPAAVAAAPVAPAAASGAPIASVVVQQLTAAATPDGVTQNKGKMAGLALIVVNAFVGLAALVLNRRRRNT